MTTHNTTCPNSPTFAVLESLALEMHRQMMPDVAKFNLVRFSRQMTEHHMLLAAADLPAFEMCLADALANHTHRVISAMQIQALYRNLLVMQDLIKTGGAK